MKVGSTRVVPCSWCGREVREVLLPYPPESGVTGTYWDCSACRCGSLAGMVALSHDRTVRMMGDLRTSRGPRGRAYREKGGIT